MAPLQLVNGVCTTVKTDCSVATDLVVGDSCDDSRCCVSGTTCTNGLCTETTACTATYWSSTGNEPCTNCSSVAHSTGSSSSDKKSCMCQSGYTWNGGACTLSTTLCSSTYWSNTGNEPCTSCSSITYSTGNSSSDRKSCLCQSGYTWNGGACTLSATLCSSTYWSSTGNEPCTSCSSIAHSTGYSSSDRKSCLCQSGYIWTGAGCTSSSTSTGTPVFTPGASTITPDTKISLSSVNSTVICYRFDGGTITCTATNCTSSYTTKYTAPFLVANGSTVKARACNSNGVASAEATAQYFWSVNCDPGYGHIGEPCCAYGICLEGECGNMGGPNTCDYW